MNQEYAYYAFISYKRENWKWASWMKKNLQTYRLPVKTHKQHPTLPRRFNRVFLDKTNLTPGILEDRLKEEVQSSRFLIVICSRAAHDSSQYIDAEIRYFMEGGGECSRIIPFVVDNSRRPEQDCFPPELQRLCEQENILGANIFEAGKRKAFLKVVAYMHGIRLDELESDDDRRRRRNIIAGTAASIALAAGIGTGVYLWWDYNVPKTGYYLDYVERYGVPEGIFPLKKEEISGMSEHYTIISKGHQVRELRHENAAGKLAAYSQHEYQERPVRAEYEYSEDKELSKVTCSDEKGRTVQVMSLPGRNTIDLVSYAEDDPYNSAGFLETTNRFMKENVGELEDISFKVSGMIVRWLVDYDEQGFLLEKRFVGDPVFNLPASDKDGVWGLRYERDAYGRTAGIGYLVYTGSGGTAKDRESYEVLGNKKGILNTSYVYDSENNLSEVRFTGKDGKPVMLREGYAEVRSSFDRKHNETERRYYGKSGESVCSLSGAACLKKEYDEKGRMTRESSFGPEGEPVLLKEGYAVRVNEYDDEGRETRYSYLGTEGEPVFADDWTAGAEMEYDAAGNEIRKKFFGISGEPVFSKNGYAARISEHDEHGRVTKYTLLDPEGKPVISGDWTAGARLEYNSSGRLTKISYFGKDGEAVLMKKGFAGISLEYDLRGNFVRYTFLGKDGTPTTAKDGEGAGGVMEYNERGMNVRRAFINKELEEMWYESYKYDDRGNNVEMSYHLPDGRLTTNPDGVAVMQGEHDAHGNFTRARYLGTDRKPYLYEGYFSEMEVSYDERGFLKEMRFFGPDGQPAEDESGIAAKKIDYDARGNRIRIENYRADGRLCEGRAVVEAEYDWRGNVIKWSAFDAAGKPAAGPKGYSSYTQEFDERGNLEDVIYYGPDGSPVNTTDGYAGKLWVYDDKTGKIYTECYLDQNMELVNNREGYARVIQFYDERGNVQAVEYRGTDDEMVNSSGGYAGWESEYDERGNMVLTMFFDTDGYYTYNIYGWAGVAREFDERGNMVRSRYLGVYGEPVAASGGITGEAFEYDELGNEISHEWLHE